MFILVEKFIPWSLAQKMFSKLRDHPTQYKHVPTYQGVRISQKQTF